MEHRNTYTSIGNIIKSVKTDQQAVDTLLENTTGLDLYVKVNLPEDLGGRVNLESGLYVLLTFEPGKLEYNIGTIKVALGDRQWATIGEIRTGRKCVKEVADTFSKLYNELNITLGFTIYTPDKSPVELVNGEFLNLYIEKRDHPFIVGRVTKKVA